MTEDSKMEFANYLKYYKRLDVQRKIVEYSKNKEVAVRYGKGFGKRPDTINYEADVMDFSKKRATSFHVSEETWKNPLSLSTELSKKELDEQRIGWDLVLDIDCALLDYSKIAAYYIIRALKSHKIDSVTCKFSGNKGFHLAVPFEAFPKTVNGVNTAELFPEAPRRIAEYIKHLIKEPITKALLKLENGKIENIIKKVGMPEEKIVLMEENPDGSKKPNLQVDEFLTVDTVLIASRHLYRMPYSLHEKSGLVSIPVNVNEVLSFDKKNAKPEVIKFEESFLEREKAKEGEASMLFIQSFDHEVKSEETQISDTSRPMEIPDEAIGKEAFPPCMKLLLEGLRDGKKRAIFCLINFLRSIGWTKEMIENEIKEWNERNPEKLREVYYKGQLRYTFLHSPKLPPNCSNKTYYEALGICKPDSLCRKIKNPTQYAKFKLKMLNSHKKKKTKKKKTKPKNDEKSENNVASVKSEEKTQKSYLNMDAR